MNIAVAPTACAARAVKHNRGLVLAPADPVLALERGAVFRTGPAAPQR